VLFRSHEAVFTKFFLQTFFHKFLFRTYREIHERGMFCSSGDKVLFTTPLGELLSRDIVTAEESITIREAAEVMSRNRISSLVLSDHEGVPTGIVTDRDLREKVVARDRSPGDPVSAVMSGVLIKADAREYCFEALLKMVHYNIHHVLVVDQGRLKGMVTNHDLMMLQGISPLSLEREIECQDSVGGLAAAARKIRRVTGMLIRENVQPGHITRIITDINDHRCNRHRSTAHGDNRFACLGAEHLAAGRRLERWGYWLDSVLSHLLRGGAAHAHRPGDLMAGAGRMHGGSPALGKHSHSGNPVHPLL